MVHYDAVWSKKNVPSHFKAEFSEELKELLKERNITNCLDLGFGEGEYLVLLAKTGINAYGLDISEQGLIKALENAKEANVNLNLQKKDVFETLPFQNNFFQLVSAFQSLSHNTKDKILDVFKEVYRVLDKNGLFALKISNRESFRQEHVEGNKYRDLDYGLLYEMVDDQTYIPLEGKEKGLLHFAFKHKQLEEEIEKLGFKILVSKRLKFHVLLIAEKDNNNWQ